MGGPGSGRRPAGGKLPEERMGHGQQAEDPRYLTASKARRRPVPHIPEASEKWLPIVRSWYNSLAASGQTELWQASDWTFAVLAANTYDRFMRTDNGNILMAFVRMSERLGVTEIDRKRARIELTDKDEVDQDAERATKTVISWKGRLGLVQNDKPAV